MPVEIIDEWETFKICFSVNHPKVSKSDRMAIRVDNRFLKVSAEGDIEMHKHIKSYEWLIQKFGDLMQPYEVLIKFQQPLQKTINEDFTFNYNYIFSDGASLEQSERQVERTLLVRAPGQYEGHLGAQSSSNQFDSSQIFIVNGMIDKCDSNFFSDFSITQVP